MNPKLQTLFLTIGAFGSIAALGNFAYITSDRMGFWKHPEPFAIVQTPIAQADAKVKEDFVCNQSNGAWTTVYQDSRTERRFIRWISDFGSKVGYSPESRCNEVTTRLNKYLQSQRPFYVSHGRSETENGKYPIICVTDFEGSGCKKDGLIYTLDPSITNPNQIVKDLLNIANNDVAAIEGGVPATSCPLYVNVRPFLHNHYSQNKKPSARYVCRT